MSRHQSRELALQVLFQVDLGQTNPDTALFHAFTREAGGDGAMEQLSETDGQYARDLVLGTWERKADLDVVIAQYAKDWAIDRMPVVDRNILRLALYEVLHQEQVPDSVAVDEAVELAKAFSTADSSKFINGILGSVIRGLGQGTTNAQPSPLAGQ